VVFVAVNTLAAFFFLLPTRLGAGSRSYIMGGFDNFVNTSFPVSTRSRLIRADIVARAAKYRGVSESVNTLHRISFSLPRFVADTVAGARIVHGSNRFGKGCALLDAKPRVRNGAIRSKEPVYALFFYYRPFFRLVDE
jgi:hypothetical protein